MSPEGLDSWSSNFETTPVSFHSSIGYTRAFMRKVGYITCFDTTHGIPILISSITVPALDGAGVCDSVVVDFEAWLFNEN